MAKRKQSTGKNASKASGANANKVTKPSSSKNAAKSAPATPGKAKKPAASAIDTSETPTKSGGDNTTPGSSGKRKSVEQEQGGRPFKSPRPSPAPTFSLPTGEGDATSMAFSQPTPPPVSALMIRLTLHFGSKALNPTVALVACHAGIDINRKDLYDLLSRAGFVGKTEEAKAEVYASHGNAVKAFYGALLHETLCNYPPQDDYDLQDDITITGLDYVRYLCDENQTEQPEYDFENDEKYGDSVAHFYEDMKKLVHQLKAEGVKDDDPKLDFETCIFTGFAPTFLQSLAVDKEIAWFKIMGVIHWNVMTKENRQECWNRWAVFGRLDEIPDMTATANKMSKALHSKPRTRIMNVGPADEVYYAAWTRRVCGILKLWRYRFGHFTNASYLKTALNVIQAGLLHRPKEHCDIQDQTTLKIIALLVAICGASDAQKKELQSMLEDLPAYAAMLAGTFQSKSHKVVFGQGRDTTVNEHPSPPAAFKDALQEAWMEFRQSVSMRGSELLKPNGLELERVLKMAPLSWPPVKATSSSFLQRLDREPVLQRYWALSQYNTYICRATGSETTPSIEHMRYDIAVKEPNAVEEYLLYDVWTVLKWTSLQEQQGHAKSARWTDVVSHLISVLCYYDEKKFAEKKAKGDTFTPDQRHQLSEILRQSAASRNDDKEPKQADATSFADALDAIQHAIHNPTKLQGDGTMDLMKIVAKDSDKKSPTASRLKVELEITRFLCEVSAAAKANNIKPLPLGPVKSNLATTLLQQDSERAPPSILHPYEDDSDLENLKPLSYSAFRNGIDETSWLEQIRNAVLHYGWLNDKGFITHFLTKLLEIQVSDRTELFKLAWELLRTETFKLLQLTHRTLDAPVANGHPILDDTTLEIDGRVASSRQVRGAQNLLFNSATDAGLRLADFKPSSASGFFRADGIDNVAFEEKFYRAFPFHYPEIGEQINHIADFIGLRQDSYENDEEYAAMAEEVTKQCNEAFDNPERELKLPDKAPHTPVSASQQPLTSTPFDTPTMLPPNFKPVDPDTLMSDAPRDQSNLQNILDFRRATTGGSAPHRSLSASRGQQNYPSFAAATSIASNSGWRDSFGAPPYTSMSLTGGAAPNYGYTPGNIIYPNNGYQPGFFSSNYNDTFNQETSPPSATSTFASLDNITSPKDNSLFAGENTPEPPAFPPDTFNPDSVPPVSPFKAEEDNRFDGSPVHFTQEEPNDYDHDDNDYSF